MKYAELLGRIFFSAIFLMSAPGHFTGGLVPYAQSQGVPLAIIAVPLSGLLALAGALLIILGFKARYGGALIVLFLAPVTVMMHNFWAVTEPMARQIQMIMFMKNLSMMGGALLIAYFGAGPLSMDAKVKPKA
ncbi:MAG: DoxX family protein [Nitrospinae bacterium]|nr:DoxX family protein [Nitrospinota bacterium]